MDYVTLHHHGWTPHTPSKFTLIADSCTNPAHSTPPLHSAHCKLHTTNCRSWPKIQPSQADDKQLHIFTFNFILNSREGLLDI